MNKDEHKPGEDERSVLSIIQDIKSGALNPKTISPEERQRCVEFLLREGYTREQVAQIFMTTDRTIRRDLVEIKRKNALTADVTLAKEIIGDMFQKAMMHHSYLVRLSRSSEAGVMEKGQLEFMAWRVLKEMVEKFQSLSYLPQKAEKIIGDFSHRISLDDEKSITDLKMQLNEVEKMVIEQGGLTPELEIEMKKLKKRIEQVEIEKDILKITEQQKKEDEKHD